MGCACSASAGDVAGAPSTRYNIDAVERSEDTSSEAAGASRSELQALFAELESYAKSRRSGGPRAVGGGVGAADDLSSVGNTTDEPSPLVDSVARAVREAKARWAVSNAEPPDPTIDVPKPDRIRTCTRRARAWLDTLPPLGANGDEATATPPSAHLTPSVSSPVVGNHPAHAASVYDDLCGAVVDEVPELTEETLEELQHSLALHAAVHRHQVAVFGHTATVTVTNHFAA